VNALLYPWGQALLHRLSFFRLVKDYKKEKMHLFEASGGGERCRG